MYYKYLVTYYDMERDDIDYLAVNAYNEIHAVEKVVCGGRTVVDVERVPGIVVRMTASHDLAFRWARKLMRCGCTFDLKCERGIYMIKYRV